MQTKWTSTSHWFVGFSPHNYRNGRVFRSSWSEALGTDNALFRLGEELIVRLPRRERSCQTLEKELQWLLRLARVALDGLGSDFSLLG